MSEPSRYAAGGFSPRFVVTRTDGKPCRPDARYMVLDGSGADPHAVKALRAYADSVRGENPELAADLDRMLAGDWPAAHAQHANAEPKQADDKMPIERAVETLNAHKHRGRSDWWWSAADTVVLVRNHETMPIHPTDALALAAYYWHRLSEGGR